MIKIIGNPPENELQMYEIFEKVCKQDLMLNKDIVELEKYIKVINTSSNLLIINFKNIFYTITSSLQKENLLTLNEMLELIEKFNNKIKG